MGSIVPPVGGIPEPSWVSGITSQAQNAVSQASSTLASIRSAGDEFEGQISALSRQITNIQLPTMPTMPTLSSAGAGGAGVSGGGFSALYTMPPVPAMSVLPDVAADDAPVFDAARPVLQLQTIPVLADMAMPAQPVLDEWVLPAAPDIDSLEPPVLADIVLPAVPQVTLPLFSVTRPGAPAVDVDDMVMQYAAEDYVSPWLQRLETEVVRGLQNGTGLSAANEDAVFGRARDRAATVQRQAEQTAMTRFASRGFQLPSGPLMAALEAARQAGADGVGEVSREVAVKRAEWEIEHYRFMLGKLGEFEGLSQQFWLGQQRMLLDAAQAVLQSKVQTYNVMASMFQAQIDAYRADTEVYKAQIEAEVQRLRVYEAQIEGAKAQSELNQQQVLVYSERQKALALDVELYKTRVEALATLEQRNTARINVFRAQVEATGSYMAAQATRAQAIATSNQAAAVPLQAYQADVSAYGERVRAYATQTEARVNVARLVSERNRDALQLYTAQVEASRIQAQAYASHMEATTSRYRADTEYMRATADIAGRTAEVFIKGTEVNLNYAMRSAEVLSKAAESAAQVAIGKAKLAQDKAIATGQVYASLAASAYGAVQATYTNTNSASHSMQLSEGHSFSHKE